MANQIKLETSNTMGGGGGKRRRTEENDDESAGVEKQVYFVPKKNGEQGYYITKELLIIFGMRLLDKVERWKEDFLVKLNTNLKGLTAKIEELGMSDMIKQVSPMTMEGEGKEKRMEENTGDDELRNILKSGEQGNLVTPEQFYEWGQRLLVELEERQLVLMKRMVYDLKGFAAPIKKATENLKGFDFLKEMEDAIKRLQDELKYKSEIKCEVSGNEHDVRNRGIELEAGPSRTVVFGGATSASATMHRGEEIKMLNTCVRQSFENDGELEASKKQCRRLLS